ncbi:cadherin-23 [Amphiprion ocellaris]|uniref:cadherin-23 n=1 Tax=Amphiprion ocellaris TaxID=80972 RepID=UPI0024117D65|nr:cadherin-23 [Amphiprion ocellaris]
MGTGGLIGTCLILSLCFSVRVISGSPIGTSTINCAAPTDPIHVGEVEEGYSGEVELLTGIVAGTKVKLVDSYFANHTQYLELIFTPGDTSATVRTKKPLDADTLTTSASTLYYSVMCDDITKYNNIRTLKVNDLNDNSPVFTKGVYTTTISEITEVDTTVLPVRAVDGDSTSANNRVFYTFSPASDDFLLTNSGDFILKRRLNYNVAQQYSFTVTARDNWGLNDTASVVINVKDFDNLNPYFSQNLYQAFIQENQAGPFDSIQPEAIKAQDGDTGINVASTYSISAVSPEAYQTNFDIDSSSGVLSVVTAFDREEMDTGVISVFIKAAQADDSLKTADAVVSVTVEDVNDNSPTFDQPNYSVTLLENSPVDAVLLKAVVNDLDQGGFVGTLEILPDSAPFSISSDGTIRVKDSTALDREATETITFQIQATEENLPHNVATAPVTVTLLDENDNSPTFTSSKYEGKVFADQTVGLSLVQVVAEDPDADVNGQVKYSIDFGNNEGYFSINENTGEISLAKTIPLVENKILEFPLYVTARDEGVIPRSSSAQVIIRAPGDSKPQFLQKIYRGNVEEAQEPGVVILRVDFLAIAAEIPVTLQVETEGDKFAISPTGEFTTKMALDYDDAPHSYSVEISITDGINSDSAVVQVEVTDINDNSPVFTSSSVTKSVPEDADVGTSITAVPATDKDSGFNKEIRYSLREGLGRFSIDPVSGMVSVAAVLDRETQAEYDLLVVAEDQGRPARSATATLLIQVSDINDNVPKFSEAEYQVEVLETEAMGTSLLSLSATDSDEGANGRVTYSITQQSPSSEAAVFALDSSSGTLQLVQPLDYSKVKVYNLKVQASDGGTPSLVGSGSVVVKVKDVNNNPPEFSKESYDVSIPENLASGASILTLEVTDKDEGGFLNGYFRYKSDTFDISNHGIVSLRKDVTLDREKTDSYILQVVAVDQITNGLSSTAQLNVTILDFNDNAPQFPSIPDPLWIPEGDYSEESQGEIFTIVPTDADLGANGEVVLSLPSPHPLFRFREDGTLLAVGPLDRESRDAYDLVVKASDKGVPQRETITTIRVSLSDVNDNRPEFSSSSYVSSILLKDAEEGKLLLTLSATDRDIGDNGIITYSFSAGSSPYLALNSDTGEVTLTSDLADITEDTTVVLTAMAKDQGQPPLDSTARVVVNLRVVSLVESVAFQSSSYNFSLPENLPVGATVGKVWASSGSNLYDVAYALKTYTDLFSIDTSGAILTTAQLDKEKQEWYILDVEAVDTRTPPTTAMATVSVQVEDVNEPPYFPPEVYEASVLSIAPYKTPVITVKASDPDVGEEGQLIYSLSAGSSYFDVEASSGQVYVVSAADVDGDTVTVEVKATDPQGLFATVTVKVVVQGSASSNDVVTISLNQPANTVENKIPELENALGKALGWTVNIIQVSNANRGATKSRMLRNSVKTLVSFITEENGETVSSQKVIKKLQSKSDEVKKELAQVFADIDFDVEIPSSGSGSSSAVIALAVMLALSILGLIFAVIFIIIRFKRKGKPEDKERLSFSSHTNWSVNITEPSERKETRSPDDEQQKTDRQTDEDGTDRDSMTDKKHRDSDSSGSQTSYV